MITSNNDCWEAESMWSETVIIELSGKSSRFVRIAGVRDAAFFLLDDWPGEKDGLYKNAIVNCSKALKGEVKENIVFESFIQAVNSSHLGISNVFPNEEFERDIIRAVKESLFEELKNKRWVGNPTANKGLQK